ncbi:MAG: hypothetical protein Q9Q40_11915 [Acidobacteriota bacterium]|nr:hypothetical protein [Acidobacteriota bacterium]
MSTDPPTGALVLVTWADAMQSVDGDMGDASVGVWRTPGVWGGRSVREVCGHDVPVVLVGLSVSAETGETDGWLAIPDEWLLSIERLVTVSPPADA